MDFKSLLLLSTRASNGFRIITLHKKSKIDEIGYVGCTFGIDGIARETIFFFFFTSAGNGTSVRKHYHTTSITRWTNPSRMLFLVGLTSSRERTKKLQLIITLAYHNPRSFEVSSIS